LTLLIEQLRPAGALDPGGAKPLMRCAMAAKKQVPLRLNEKLYDAIAQWAEDDFRSVNGQIEYLLTECVRQRKKNGKYVSEHLDEPIELDI
jgi:hypothetical protein